jgi:hypothetical protein
MDLQNIVLDDHAGADKTFAVIGNDANVARFADKSGGIPLGYPTITHEVREAKTPTGANRVIITITLPTVATVDGQNVKTRVSSAQVAFNFAQGSTLNERKDLVAFLAYYIGKDVDPDLLNQGIPEFETYL